MKRLPVVRNCMMAMCKEFSRWSDSKRTDGNPEIEQLVSTVGGSRATTPRL